MMESVQSARLVRTKGNERKNREAVRHNSLGLVDLVDVSKFRRTKTLWRIRSYVARKNFSRFLYRFFFLMFCFWSRSTKITYPEKDSGSSLITAESIISSWGWNQNREIGLLVRGWIGNAIRNGEIRSAEKFLAVVLAREDYSRPFSRRNRVCARPESSGEKLN